MNLVFITGASSGIGQALALAYLQKGWRVAVVARRADTLNAWVQALQKTMVLDSEQVGVFHADVQNTDSLIAAADDCIAQMGVPDVVIANAGISLGIDTAEREDLAVMKQVMETNVLGMATTFHPFIRAMQTRGAGTLVGIASVAGIRGLPGHAAYCASKAAVISYCESLRGELRSSGIRVITIAPGYVATPLTERNRYPMPFLMTPDAFAHQAIQTISRGTSYRVIPWPMGLIAKLLAGLPNALFDRLLTGRPRKHRHSDR
ncbi:short-chain dehydrogenase [Limnohabitans sp. T6-5]|uniref:SDR family oxidoreductase n=1 Tax=Limnohabitans sp. T6-5 TaxID=1100724 RepID=UPI000D364F12|nr:SDR family oxidoreductase [Limnohabitans sp. T6-5]PUE06327.1 short-chain dehydrogenase [Limnohabitans sp. T6-5]